MKVPSRGLLAAERSKYGMGESLCYGHFVVADRWGGAAKSSKKGGKYSWVCWRGEKVSRFVDCVYFVSIRLEEDRWEETYLLFNHLELP